MRPAELQKLSKTWEQIKLIDKLLRDLEKGEITVTCGSAQIYIAKDADDELRSCIILNQRNERQRRIDELKQAGVEMNV